MPFPYPAADGPWGAVHPPSHTPWHPLAIGQEFTPPRPVLAADNDWAALKTLAAWHDWQLPLHWRRELQRPGLALVLTDATQQICWVNTGFTHMSGYPATEALGQRPGFLQGADTAATTRASIRQRLLGAQPFATTVLNYRRNGQPYWCHVRIRPVHNKAGVLTHFLAFEHEVPEPRTS